MSPPIGLDIGGANLKLSDGEQQSLSHPFPLWKMPGQLAAAISGLLREFESPSALAVTTTGELADCFATKAEGVRHILQAVEDAAPGIPLHVWTTGSEFVSPHDARELVPLVAAANWHALATWAARSTPRGSGLLVDIGSTTTDIIPLSDGLPIPTGRTDPERLHSHELVYTGVRRTPVCSVISEVPLRNNAYPLAAELFATMLDVHLLLGSIPENETDLNTANGRPATIACARDRLARMLCADTSEIDAAELQRIAAAVAAAQQSRIANALQRVRSCLPGPCELILSAGEGAFLLEQATAGNSEWQTIPRLNLSHTLGPHHSQSACAYALARLAREQLYS
jgi:(4-(4-[2-(gamma-L-glutamylamino)ethyl]phenoxymethyl)furan-2-yl)methanamine synthase